MIDKTLTGDASELCLKGAGASGKVTSSASAGRGKQDAGNGTQEGERRKRDAGNRTQETERRKRDAGNGTQETGEGAGANEVNGVLSEASRCGAPIIKKEEADAF